MASVRARAAYGARSPGPGRRSKKTSRAAEQTRPDVAAARSAWRERQPALNPERLVFIDEAWTTTNMTRLRARAQRGERAEGFAPHGHWHTTTFLAGLRIDGLVAPFVIGRAMNGPIFRTYVEKVLAPELRPEFLDKRISSTNCAEQFFKSVSQMIEL
jgi:hypothetical protein